MIFKKASEVIETGNVKIDIHNMECSNYHWRNAKEIKNFLESVETLLPIDNDNSVDELLNLTIEMINDLPRVNEVKFYREKDKPNNLFMVNFTDIDNMGSLNLLERYSSIFLKKTNNLFCMFEFSKDQSNKIEKNELTLPESWIFDEDLTKKFSKYRKAFSVW